MYTDEQERVLDKHLGNIHSAAIALAMVGQSNAALVLAEAYEAIRDYVITNDIEYRKTNETAR